jgi:dTDP-4-amino-4,6-dideoxygalactose transaminase
VSPAASEGRAGVHASDGGPPVSVPLLDLHGQFRALEVELRAAVDGVLADQQFIMGPQVAAFEVELAAYCGTRFAFGVSSGTDALLAALMALDVRPGDEVVTTPYSFFATAGAIARLGAIPVFVDIDPLTFNLDHRLMEEVVGPRTVGVIPVHLFGQMADMASIVAFAREHGLFVVEDAAQAIGAELEGRRAGSWGDVGCLSFFPSKNLGAWGDAGAVSVSREDLAERLDILRQHGARPKYHHSLVGGNFRLDALQAAILRVKLPHLDGWTEAREDNAARYRSLFVAAGMSEEPNGVAGPEGLHTAPVVLPYQAPERRHIYNQFILRVRERDALLDHLHAAAIGSEVYYPVPLHLQECFSDLGYTPGDLPQAEAAARETLALPVYPELTVAQQERVVEAVADFFRGR